MSVVVVVDGGRGVVWRFVFRASCFVLRASSFELRVSCFVRGVSCSVVVCVCWGGVLLFEGMW